MKQLYTLGAAVTLAALLSTSATDAFAGQIINVTGYSTPDAQGFNTVTTNVTGAPDTPYSYYTGPIGFTVENGDPLTVYCVDLNHYLHAGLYEYTRLDTNGEGQPISEFDSNRIANIAVLGEAALAAGGLANLDLAAAAQAAIWEIAYNTDSPSAVTADATIQADIAMLLADVFPNTGYALALRPYGQGWSAEASASQEMVVGFMTDVDEPGSLGLLGTMLVGAGYMIRRRRNS